VKSLREEVAREREIGHKMAVKLAKYRRKERERELQTPQLLVTSPTQDSDQFKDRDEVLTILTHTHAHDWDGHCDDNCGNLAAGQCHYSKCLSILSVYSDETGNPN
jgi:hypothetical protein